MVTDKDPARSARMMQALLQMKKLDLAALEAAYGPSPKRAAARKKPARRSARRRSSR